jgi:hypothetical protein
LSLSSTRLVDEPPIGAVWVHEIKFDGYRMQLRVEKGRASLRTRKALDWTQRFGEIAAEGRRLPDCMIDGEICALDENGLPSFAGLQQALSEGNTAALVFYVFDLLFLEGVDLRQEPLSTRKEMLADLIASTDGLPRFRYVEHFATSGRNIPQDGMQSRSRRHYFQALGRALSLGPQRFVDEGKMPRRPGSRHRRLVGRTGKKSVPFSSGLSKARTSSIVAASAPASTARIPARPCAR